MSARGLGRAICLAGFAAVVWSGTGCASLEERDRLAMANRTLEARKAELETELYDTRAVSETLRQRLASIEGTLGDKDRLINNLQTENDRLEGDVSQTKGLLERVADRGVSPVVVLEKALPPALDTALREFAQSHPGVVQYDDKRGIVKWVSDVLFVSGSDEVMDPAKQSLREFTNILKSPAAADFEAVIVGHTDNVAIKREATLTAHRTNWHLSSHRSIAVGNVLLETGYAPDRVSVTGCGEFRPVAPNDTAGNKSLNRRVDVYIVPRGSIVAAGTTNGTPAGPGR